MRYIDADRLLSESTLSRTASNWDTCITVDDIDACPTEDVAPVIHAHWITRNRKERLYQCSHCGAGDSFPNDLEVNYCWNCGAKMDEEREEPKC